MPQLRVSNGQHAQMVVRDACKMIGAEIISVAAPGSQRPDLIASFNNTPIQFEIKHSQTQTSVITMYSETVHYGQPSNIDHVVKMLSFGGYSGIADAVRGGKLFDRTVGFPGEAEVPSTGKLPLLMATDVNTLINIREHVIKRLSLTGNTYLTLMCKEANNIHTYWTGIGTNVLGAPPIPAIRVAKLSTYGASPDYTMRVALKVQFYNTPGHPIH